MTNFLAVALDAGRQWGDTPNLSGENDSIIVCKIRVEFK